MYSAFQLAIKYIRYYFTASNGKGHGIHSPFVFDLVTKVLNDQQEYPAYHAIESLRRQLLNDPQQLQVEDFGAGSTAGFTKERTVQQIASTSLKQPKFARLLYRLVNYFQPKQVLELGTSLGITTAYLAKAKTDGLVNTLEGSNAIATVAARNFQQLDIHNIQLVKGNFDTTLQPTLDQLSGVLNFVFVDGNHREEPTIRYFEQLKLKSDHQTVMIFDDIHWSKEMEAAWEKIKQDPSVTLTIDLFFIGLVFFRKEHQEKEHFVIRF